jgi:hypothetical protein
LKILIILFDLLLPAGCDIYSGCCTLKVEYGRQTKLNVKKNDDSSWDYTTEDADLEGQNALVPAGGRSDRPVLLAEPRDSSVGPGRRSGAEPSMGSGMGAAGGMGNMGGGMGSMGAGSMGAGMGSMGGGMGSMGAGMGGDMSTANALAGINPVQLAAVISSLASGGLLNLNALGGGGGMAGNPMNNIMGAMGMAGGGGGAVGMGGGVMGMGAASMGMGGGAMGMGGAAPMGMGGGMVGDGGGPDGYGGADYYDSPGGGGGYADGRGPVLMLYGLEASKFNCARLFNLLCVYGNVRRIMFLKNKEGTAMVQMDSPEAVSRVMDNLSQTTIFGSPVRTDWSKKDCVTEVRQPFRLPDGTDNFATFETDRNNRFDTPQRAARNRILPPGPELLFFNVPKLENDELEEVFTKAGATVPIRIKWFPSSSGSKAASGVVEFSTVEEAVNALVLCNHTQVEGNKGARYPFVMKLCFSEGAVRGKERYRSRSRGRGGDRERDRSRGGDRDRGGRDRSRRDRDRRN